MGKGVDGLFSKWLELYPWDELPNLIDAFRVGYKAGYKAGLEKAIKVADNKG